MQKTVLGSCLLSAQSACFTSSSSPRWVCQWRLSGR